MSEVDRILELLQPDPEIMDTARRRQADIWRNRQPDYLPIIVQGVPSELQKQYPSYNLKECYFDRDRMLAQHLWGMIAMCSGRGDGLPSMRCNSGVGTLATVFGCTNTVYEDKMPWITTHISKRQLEDFQPDRLASRGEMPRVLDYMRYFRRKLDGKAAVYCADNQGPLDLAHIVYGHELFTDMYDDPEFVHRLLEKCAAVIIEGVKLMKDAAGEPLDSGYHSNHLYMENGGIRVCEDSTTLLSAAMVDEFVIPYTQKVLQAFGGGWIHFCGGDERLFGQLVRARGARGINFGNSERFDPGKVLKECVSQGRFYNGGFKREENESLEDFFRRLLRGLKGVRKGLILHAALKPGEIPAPAAADLWRSIQDLELCP